MSYYQICGFLKITLLLTIIVTVKSRPDMTTTQPQTDAALDGLNVTGGLNEEVNKLLVLPRCGVPDKNLRPKRYVLFGSFWNVNNLTYNILNTPMVMNETEVDIEIARAFSLWSEQTNLTFTRKKTGKVDITIEFVKPYHGNCDPLTHALAHASYPKKDASIHFHYQVSWTINSTDGLNLFQTAAHEIGHVLGLEHSEKKEAVMAPYYGGYNPNFKLDEDDIQAIKFLYDNKSLPVKNGPFLDFALPRTKNIHDLFPSVAQNNDLCKSPKIDVIFNSADNETYVFKDVNYYKMTGYSVADGYPKLISDGWPGLPGDIDAAFAYKNGTTYFFKGAKYWQYNGSQMDVGYPKEIREGFPGVPDNLDTAFAWGESGKIFFLKDNKFWLFDLTKKALVNSSYINTYSDWKHLPGNFDAAYVEDNDVVNFFKNDKLYQVDVDNASSNVSTFRHITLPSGILFGCFSLMDTRVLIEKLKSNDKPEVSITPVIKYINN